MADEAPLAGRDDIRRILIIKWSALGDAVIASALMEDVARAFPLAEIHLNTMAGCAGIFANDPRFTQVFSIDVRDRTRRWKNAWAWVRRVRSGRYDLLIDFQRSDHSRFLLALLVLMGGAPRHRLGNRGGFPFTRQPAVRDPRSHAFRMMQSVLESAGIPARTRHPVLYPTPESLAKVKAVRQQHGLEDGRYAVLLPGSHVAGRLKRWGSARYAELAGRLHRQGVDRIVVIGGPDEIEDCATIATAGEFVNLNGVLSLLEIAPLCAGATAIVGNDTGTAHFSSAAGRPLLVLCGPTDPRRVKPIGEQVVALQASLPCSSCYGKECVNPTHHACMSAITPEFLAARFQDLAAGRLQRGDRFDGGLVCY